MDFSKATVVKNFFNKLLPYSDEAAAFAKNYGRNAEKLSNVYGSNFANTFTSYTDDIVDLVNSETKSLSPLEDLFSKLSSNKVRLLNDSAVGINGKTFHYPATNSPQDILKGKLMAKRTGLNRPKDIVNGFNLKYFEPDSFKRLKDVTNFKNVKDVSSTRLAKTIAENNNLQVPTDVNFLGETLNLNGLVGRMPNIVRFGNISTTMPVDNFVFQASTLHPNSVSLRPHAGNEPLMNWFKKHYPSYVPQHDSPPSVDGNVNPVYDAPFEYKYPF